MRDDQIDHKKLQGFDQCMFDMVRHSQ